MNPWDTVWFVAGLAVCLLTAGLLLWGFLVVAADWLELKRRNR